MCRFAQVCAFVCPVLEPPVFQPFCFVLFAPAAAAAISCLYQITPCLKLSSFLLCGSHCTTAVAQQVCVDQFFACVDIAYMCGCDVCAMVRKHNNTWYVACATTAAVTFKVNTILNIT